jgi:cell division protein FtsN
MAKRSKNQARRSGTSMAGWKWLAVGLAIGGLAFGYLQFRDKWSKPDSTLPQPNPQAQAPVATGDNGVPDVERPKPKYDFYTLLPEKEVVIPDAELDAQARAEAAKAAKAAAAVNPASTNQVVGTAVSTPASETPATSAVGSGGPHYLIQAGAFRGSAEAEALKAQIALTGEIARVEVAQINGNTVHRVRMGPYPNASALAAAKQALASHGITAQAIKVK